MRRARSATTWRRSNRPACLVARRRSTGPLASRDAASGGTRRCYPRRVDREGLIRLRAARLPLLVLVSLVLVTACAGEAPATARRTTQPASTQALASEDA